MCWVIYERDRGIYICRFYLRRRSWWIYKKGGNNMAENKSLFYDAKEVMEMLDLKKPKGMLIWIRPWQPVSRLSWSESTSCIESLKSHLMHGWSRSTNPSRTDFDSWKTSNRKGYSIVPRKKKIPRNDLGIPEYEMESLARMLLPILKKYIDSEEGKRDWQEWQAWMKNGANGTMSTESKEELNLSDRN